jgi:outer membrane protein assembly factor BamB
VATPMTISGPRSALSRAPHRCARSSARRARRLLPLVALLLLAAGAGAADLAWPPGSDRAALPAGWEFEKSPTSAGKAVFAKGSLQLTSETTRFCHVARALGIDGDDQAPLRIEARIGIEHQGELSGMPTYIALYWGPTSALCVGLGGVEQWVERWMPARRRAWSYYLNGAEHGFSRSDTAYYSGAVPGYFRLLLTSHDVSAFASMDGLRWQLLSSFERKPGQFAGAPERVIIGRGWAGDQAAQQQPHLANDLGDPNLSQLLTWTVSNLTITNEVPKAPALASYRKPKNLDEAREALLTAQPLREWQLLGPLPWSDKPYALEKELDLKARVPLADGKEGGWLPWTLDEHAGPTLSLKAPLKLSGENQISFATATIHAEAERAERFWFDGQRAMWLYVNGVPVGNTWHDEEPIADRWSAVATLHAGENRILVKAVARGGDARCVISLRHEPADPLNRIALLERLAADFPEDAENGIMAINEVAGLWEGLGQTAKAAAVLSTIPDHEGVSVQQLDSSFFERSRLHRLLRDQAAVALDIEQLAKRRLAANSNPADAAVAGLKIAQLWEQMGFPDKGLAAIDAMLKGEGVSPELAIESGFERARLHQLLKQDERVPDDLRDIALRLPVDHPERFEILLESVARELELGKQDGATALLAAQPKDAQGEGRGARVHNLLAAAAETRGDQAARLKELQAVIDAGHGTEAMRAAQQVEYAEAAAAAGKESDAAVADAIAHYQKALQLCVASGQALVQERRAAAEQALGAHQGAQALQALRAAYVRACLAESPAGVRLLEAALANAQPPAAAPAGAGTFKNLLLAPLIKDFWAIGPFPNEAWQCYDKPPVAAGKVDLGKVVQGLKWIRPGPDAYKEGVLDLKGLFVKDNSVAFVYREIDVPAAADGELSCGADDGLVLWFNGKKLHEDREQRAAHLGDIIIPVKFAAGTNTLLAMVQQGGGDWGVIINVTSGASRGLNIAQALAMAERSGDARAAAAAVLSEQIDGLVKAGEAQAAAAVARLVARAFPERPDLQLAAVDRLPDHELVAFIEDVGERRGFPDKRRAYDSFRPRAADHLRAHGDLGGAVQLLRRIERTVYEADTQTHTLVQLADLYRMAGYPRIAADYYRRAGERPIKDEALRAKVHEGLFRVRGDKSENAAFQTSLDAGTMVQTADRAITAGDVERGLRTYQRALDTHGAELIKLGDGKLVGISEYIADRLSALGEAAIASYRKLFDARASERFDQAMGLNDAAAFELVAHDFPAASVAAKALERAASLALAGGAPRHAADLLRRVAALCLADTMPAVRALLTAKLAYAELNAGDITEARAATARLAAPPCAGCMLTVRGKQVAAEAYAGELNAALELLVKAGQPRWTTTGGEAGRRGQSVAAPLPTACRFETVLPVHPAELLAAERFAPAPWQHLMLQVASDGVLAYLHTPDECFAIELSSGALKWRSSEGFAALRRPIRSEAFAGLPETMTTVLDGRVFARALHHGSAGAVFAIESRDAQSGNLAWSSEAGEATSDASAVSSPACAEGVVVAVFQDVQERSRSFAVAFAASDGRLLWRTPLAFGLASLTLSSQQEIYLGDHLAAPSISGGDVYISTDMGSVVDLELSSGVVRWAATYPRALLDPVAGAEIVRQLADRAASRVVVGPELIYVAPRDTLAVMAIMRANGTVRWRQELSDARALVGIAGSPERAALITQGRGLTALAALSGEERWHWSPSGDDQLWGAAAIGGKSIYVPTASVLARLDALDGRSQGQQAWSEFGLDRPIGNLVLLNDLVLGVGKDRLVALQAGQAAKLHVEVPPRASEAHLALTGLSSADFAPPLAFRWRLASGPAAMMFHPVGGNPAELYLGLDDRLLRLDADGAHIIWDAPVPPGMLHSEVIGSMLLATYPRSIVAIDNASGRLLWTRALSYDDAGFFLDTENRGDRRFAEAVATPTVVASWRPGARQVEVCDAHSGAFIARIAFPSELHWVGISGDQILGLQTKGDRCWIEGRVIGSGAIGWTQDLAVREKWIRRFAATLSPDRATAYLAFEANLVAVDLNARKVLYTEAFQLSEGPTLAYDGAALVSTGRRGDGYHSQAISPQTGKTFFDVEFHHGWGTPPLSPYRFTGDRALSISDQRVDRHQTVICRAAADGKELWTADLGDLWHHRCVGAEVVGRLFVVIDRTNEDMRLRYRCYALEDGRPVGGGMLPGLDQRSRETVMATAMLGGQLVYGCTDGVCAVGALPPAAGGHPSLEAAIANVAASKEADREGASEFLAIHRPDLRPALFTRQPMRIDGHLDDWTGIDAIELGDAFCVRAVAGASWGGPQSLSAHARVAWDRRFVYISAESRDDHFEAPAPGGSPLDGDCLVVGIDPDANNGGNEERHPLVLALSLSPRDGRTRITQLSGPALASRDTADEGEGAPKEGEDDRASARIVRAAGGCTYELALPWASLRPNPNERPGYRTTMGIGLAVVDWQDGRPRAALEWGNGLVRGISPSRFSQVAFVDLTPERIASYRKFIELMPSHEFAWRFESRIAATHVGLAGVPGRISEIEGFIKANPGSVHAARALSELARLYRAAAVEQPQDKAASLAAGAGVAARAIGDALGPCSQSKDQGRAFRQWVFLDPARPAQEIMLQFHTLSDGMNHRAYWGGDLIGAGEPNSWTRWPQGALPAAGQWVQLVVPIGGLNLDGKQIDAISFVVHDGMANWGRSEFVADGKVQVLLDGALPPKVSFDRGVEWSDKVLQDGKKSHTIGYQAGDGGYALRDGSFSIDLRLPPPPAPDKERLKTYEQAAKLIAESEEAFPLLREAEGQFNGMQPAEAHTEAIIGMYRSFLKVDSDNPQAVQVLTFIRALLEDWSNEKPPPKRAAAVARCEALMNEAKLGREIRRQFYGWFSPGIAEWKLLGWFDSQKGAHGLLEVLAPERGEIDFDAHYANQRGDELHWQDVHANPVNLNGEANVLKFALKSREHEHRRHPVAYACTRLEAAASTEAVLLIGVKGECLVWVNGKRVGGQLIGERNLQRDAFALPCKLNKGLNEILVKAAADDGAAQLCLRVADLNGKPIEGLVSRLPPGLVAATPLSATKVAVAFSGPVEKESAEALANYSLDRGTGVTAVSLSKDRRTATLTTAALEAGADYVLSLGPIKSTTGTPLRDGSRLRFRLPSGEVGGGLKAEFFEGREFKDLLVTRTDETIDFDWADGEQPDPAVHANSFCIRWSGQLLPRYSDSYTFTTVSDDGIRMWVDGKKLIDNWTDHGPTEDNGTIALEAGRKVDLTIEYFQGASTACAKLMWASGKQAQEVVPASQLFQPAAAAAAPASGKK